MIRKSSLSRFLLTPLVGIGIGGIPLPILADPLKPNILLIVSEDNGPELGCYGDPYAQTPVLDRLATEGVRFENAFVPYSVCSPSRACFLTGLYPHQNGQIGLATHKFAMYRNHLNLFTELTAAGYRTGLIGKLHVNPESAFPVDYRPISGANFGKRNMREYAAAARKFFEAGQSGDSPFFLSINYPDAHFPVHRQQFGLPEEPLDGKDVKPLPWVGADSPRLREFTANYYNCMRRLDDGVGMLMQELEQAGAAENTLIIYIGDHGAQFSRVKGSVYEAGLRVPFIVHWKQKIIGGSVRDELISTLDIMPTLLSIADTQSPGVLPGRNLIPLLNGEVPEDWREFIYATTTGAAPAIAHFQQSVRDARWKLISNPLVDRENRSALAYLNGFNSHFAAGTRADEISAAPQHVRAAYDRYQKPPRYELYDLKQDPQEWHNLADSPDYSDTKKRLIDALRDWQGEMRDPFADADLLRDFADRQDAMTDLSYRKDKTFRWPYLDRFPLYMKVPSKHDD